jgi:hypothetical protein
MTSRYDPADDKPGGYAIALGYKYRATLLSQFLPQPRQVGVGDLFTRQSCRPSPVANPELSGSANAVIDASEPEVLDYPQLAQLVEVFEKETVLAVIVGGTPGAALQEIIR